MISTVQPEARTSSNAVNSVAFSSLSQTAGRFVRQLRQLASSDFSDDQDANTRNSVLAYIQTYNNMLSSAGSSSGKYLGAQCKSS